MPISLSQSATAVGRGGFASFYATGGTAPYVYSVQSGGAGGSINSSTGVYTGPATLNSNPRNSYDTIVVTDAAAATASKQILVGSPLLLFCEIIQRQLGLAQNRVYLWDQKLMQPTDNDLYVAVSVPWCKPFANVNRPLPTESGMEQDQFIAMLACLDIDIISRGPAARDRKEEVLIALNSVYAQQQQEAFGFFIGKLPPVGRFINLSDIDGAAIPYRFKISIQMQYAWYKTTAIEYYDDFSEVEVHTDPQQEED